MNSRGAFNSNFGAVAAAAGSAIGLGNIWRFPYVAGENGGAAFILIYLAIVAVIGIPLIMTEFALGRHTRQNVFGTFRTLSPKGHWYLIGVIGITTSVIIMSFYSIIAGWTLSFLELSITNSFVGMSSDALTAHFNDFVNSGVQPILYMALFVVITAVIVMLGVEKGIERYNKILMPVLFLILVVLSINSFTLDGAQAGLDFLFKADFSKVDTNVVLGALGQAFFSLSIGMGCLMTYGSYIRNQDNIFKTASMVITCDVFIAILAGIAIFPAVFTFGIEPASGPNLVFITLPNIFAQMSGGYIFSLLFFILLTVAALTSSVSMMEVFVAYLTEEFNVNRVVSAIIATVIIVSMGVLCALSQMEGSSLTILGNNIFDSLDLFTSSFMLPISGFLIVIYAGWVMKRHKIRNEIVANSTFLNNTFGVYYFLIRYVAPLAIIIVFLSKIGII